MPITANQVDSLILCDSCDEVRVIEPATITVFYGPDDEVVPLCESHADHGQWSFFSKKPVTHPAEALAAWDESTPEERQAAIDDYLPVGHKAGDRR